MPLESCAGHSDGSPYSPGASGVSKTDERQTPRNAGGLVVGIGCRRGVSAAAIASALRAALARLGSEGSDGPISSTIGLLASIDAKANEAGLLAFAEQHGLALRFFSAEALAPASVAASASAAYRLSSALPSETATSAGRHAPPPDRPSTHVVRQRFGIDHVCEAAARTACPTGNVLLPKTVFGDVTLSIVAPIAP